MANLGCTASIVLLAFTLAPVVGGERFNEAVPCTKKACLLDKDYYCTPGLPLHSDEECPWMGQKNCASEKGTAQTECIKQCFREWQEYQFSTTVIDYQNVRCPRVSMDVPTHIQEKTHTPRKNVQASTRGGGSAISLDDLRSKIGQLKNPTARPAKVDEAKDKKRNLFPQLKARPLKVDDAAPLKVDDAAEPKDTPKVTFALLKEPTGKHPKAKHAAVDNAGPKDSPFCKSYKDADCCNESSIAARTCPGKCEQFKNVKGCE